MERRKIRKAMVARRRGGRSWGKGIIYPSIDALALTNFILTPTQLVMEDNDGAEEDPRRDAVYGSSGTDWNITTNTATTFTWTTGTSAGG